jgi:hypothetical protein
VQFYEKPPEGVTTSRLASVVFYCFHRNGLSTVKEFLELNPSRDTRSFGKYLVGIGIRLFSSYKKFLHRVSLSMTRKKWFTE